VSTSFKKRFPIKQTTTMSVRELSVCRRCAMIAGRGGDPSAVMQRDFKK